MNQIAEATNEYEMEKIEVSITLPKHYVEFLKKHPGFFEDRDTWVTNLALMDINAVSDHISDLGRPVDTRIYDTLGA